MHLDENLKVVAGQVGDLVNRKGKLHLKKSDKNVIQKFSQETETAQNKHGNKCKQVLISVFDEFEGNRDIVF